jgi:TonB family protein
MIKWSVCTLMLRCRIQARLFFADNEANHNREIARIVFVALIGRRGLTSMQQSGEVMEADRVLLVSGNWRKSIRPGRKVTCLLALLLANCTDINYQDRARSPLKPMKSVVHAKTDDFDTPPKVVEGARPAYPEAEAKSRERGYVVIVCTIGVDGRARDFEVELMTNPAFAYAAVIAIQKWRWVPALKNGQPVAQKIRVPMHFNAI